MNMLLFWCGLIMFLFFSCEIVLWIMVWFMLNFCVSMVLVGSLLVVEKLFILICLSSCCVIWLFIVWVGIFLNMMFRFVR